MFKTTDNTSEEDFEKPKIKKPKRKCTERQLENLRKARAVAKANRDAKKKKQLVNNKPPTATHTNNVEPTIKVEPRTTETPTHEDIKVERQPVRNPIKTPRRRQLKRQKAVVSDGNPLNIDFTEVFKHHLTLQHQKLLYVNHQRRKELLQRRNNRSNRQNNNIVNNRVRKNVVKKQALIPPPQKPKNNLNKYQNDFFDGLFD